MRKKIQSLQILYLFVIGIVLIFFLISTGRCNMSILEGESKSADEPGPEMSGRTVAPIDAGKAKKSLASKEEVLDHFFNILQTVRNEDTECGIFNNTNIKDGEIYKKVDSKGGTYIRKKYDSGRDTDISRGMLSLEIGRDPAIVYEFTRYTGDLQMNDGSIMSISGRILGKNWKPEKGSMTISGRLILRGVGATESKFDFYSIGINNGSDGSKCGTLDSVVKVRGHLTNRLYLSYWGTGRLQTILLQKLNLRDPKEVHLWQKLIKFH